MDLRALVAARVLRWRGGGCEKGADAEGYLPFIPGGSGESRARTPKTTERRRNRNPDGFGDDEQKSVGPACQRLRLARVRVAHGAGEADWCGQVRLHAEERAGLRARGDGLHSAGPGREGVGFRPKRISEILNRFSILEIPENPNSK